MEKISAILIISTIIWYIIDRFKDSWSGKEFSKYITIGVAGILSGLCVFGFNLDLINALNLTTDATFVGSVITTLALMTGSSAISEIIGKIKQPSE